LLQIFSLIDNTEKFDYIFNMQERMTRVEMKIAFMEDTVETLNALVAEQQKIIDGLLLKIERLESKISDLAEIAPGLSIPNKKPPHY